MAVSSPHCVTCGLPADFPQVTLHSLRFYCNRHNDGPDFIHHSPTLHRFALFLRANPVLKDSFWTIMTALPDQIVSELKAIWGKSDIMCRFQACGDPESVLILKDRNRLMRFICISGLHFPCEFMDQFRSERILLQMIKMRTSVSVIKLAFEKWPDSGNEVRVMERIVKSPYAHFEVKLLLEMLLPHYLELALKGSTVRLKTVLGKLRDRKVKTLSLQYIRLIETRYVLKAMERSGLMQRLPGVLRRYVVESFLTP